MSNGMSDAFVFFGATGDLAYKQIFPSLQDLIRDEGFNIPIIGVAKAGWNLDQLKARAKESLEEHGGLEQASVRKAHQPASLRRRRLRRRRHLHRASQATGRCQGAAALSRGAAQPVRHGCRGTGKIRLRRQCARRHRKAFRPQPADGAGTQSHAAQVLSRREYLPHRSLSRQRAGAEHSVHPLRQSGLRAHLEPRICALHSDHDGGELRRERSRQVLRRDRRAARRGAEPHAAGAGQSHHGSADRRRSRSGARLEGRAAESGPSAEARRRSARPIQRLQAGRGRGSRFDGRNLHRHQALHRYLAVGWRADLHSRRKMSCR